MANLLVSAGVNPKRLAYNLDRVGLSLPQQVVKRDGSRVRFDISKIEKAITRCFESDDVVADTPVNQVVVAVANMIASRYGTETPTVEQLQDLVELTLLSLGENNAARHYVSYRDEHAKARGLQVPSDVRDAFDADRIFFPTPLRQFQYYDKYARFNWDYMRRETWVETVNRVVDYLQWLVATETTATLSDDLWFEIRDFILEQKAMPSMRALAMAGDPAKRNSLAIYNCSYLPVKDLDVFAEAMLISLAGCGVGYSVERQYVEQFPRIKRQTGVRHVWTVEDSAEGWAESYAFGLRSWFNGEDVDFDYSLVRPEGAVLKTKGGRASGPAPLKRVHDFARALIIRRQGSTLSTLDAHDLMCATGDAAVSGKVRRTAMIALFSWDDEDMRTCKDGDRLEKNPVRWNANNSAVWPDDLSQQDVMRQMLDMFAAGRGEPGIFSRSNAVCNAPQRREPAEFGTNPCGEIILRPFGLCNLSIAVARQDDTLDTLRDKVRIAATIGTIQSLATNFPGLRDEWKQNCVDERLLGVDITGQMDCPIVQQDWVQRELADEAVRVNAMVAEQLGINPAAAVTCNKPSGNSSQLLDSSSGIHRRWAPYYVRRTRVGAATPLYRVLRDAGVPMKPENGQHEDSAETWVVSWPVAAPEGSPTRKDATAVEQCEYWLLCKLNWAEHNPSVTITYQPDEILDLTKWVWDNRHLIGGMAFLPADDAQYEQAPYEEISQEQYEELAAAFPAIDFSLLYVYEHSDMTTAAQELACMAGSCDM